MGALVAVLRTIAVAAILHGVFTITIPYWIHRRTAGIDWAWFDCGALRWSGALSIAFGIYLYGWSIAHLLRHQTSALPGLRASQLRIDGWYGRSRHPMLLGVVLILFGEAVFFESLALLAYALAYWLWLNAFVAFKEEPDLQREFGDAYLDYRRKVPRWVPRLSRLT